LIFQAKLEAIFFACAKIALLKPKSLFHHFGLAVSVGGKDYAGVT
jgi:hypothetical protein